MPDLPDPTPKPCQVEKMQIEYLTGAIGWVLYADLEDMVAEDTHE